jgi:hypothetical protein
MGHGEEINLSSSTDVMTPVNPVLQSNQLVHQKPFLISVPLGVPTTQQVDSMARGRMRERDIKMPATSTATTKFGKNLLVFPIVTLFCTIHHFQQLLYRFLKMGSWDRQERYSQNRQNFFLILNLGKATVIASNHFYENS